MNTNTVIAAVVIAGTLLAYGAWTSIQGTGAVSIGAVLSLTGAAAVDGESIRKGIELAVSELRESGVSVDLVVEDDGTDPKNTLSALTKVAAVDKVDVVIGPTWSFLVAAGVETVTREKLVAFAPAVTTEFVDGTGVYNFQGAPKNALKTGPMSEWLKEHNKKRVAIIVDNFPWGASNARAMRDAARAAGATVVLDEQFNPFDGNVADTIGNLLLRAEALDADVVMYTGFEDDAVALVKRANEYNVSADIVAASTVPVRLAQIGTLSPKELERVVVVVPTRSQEFVEKYRAAYGTEPSDYADTAYFGTLILAEAVQKVGTENPDALAAYVREHGNFDERGDIIGGEWSIRKVVQ